MALEKEAGDVKDKLSMAYNKMVGVIKEAAKEVIGVREPGLRGAKRETTDKSNCSKKL